MSSHSTQQALIAITSKKKSDSADGDTGDSPGDKTAIPFPGTWSVGFCGGTIERIKERCAGDFNVVNQTKHVLKVSGLSGNYPKNTGGLNSLNHVDIVTKI